MPGAQGHLSGRGQPSAAPARPILTRFLGQTSTTEIPKTLSGVRLRITLIVCTSQVGVARKPKALRSRTQRQF